MEEQVALYDAAGHVVGSAPRARVRAENLHHGATAVVVRDSWGRVYVHRRSTGKDVYPGLLDFCAGGVIQSGEEPYASAVREVGEELGVAGVALHPAGEGSYADHATSYHAYLYWVTYEGPIRWQPEEVAWGEWVELDALLRHLDGAPEHFVPDSTALWASGLDAWASDRRELPRGWDCVATLVEGRWVDRSPQRPEVEASLLAETELMPVIAARVPLEVPVPRLVSRDPLRVRHVVVDGDPVDPDRLGAADGAVLGQFLRQLHAIPLEDLPAGARGASSDGEDRAAQLCEVESTVVPLLPTHLHGAGRRLIRDLAVVGEQSLTHADLVPEHLLVRDGTVTGVIDWGDARVTDPALDLAWLLHGTPAEFADALRAAYGVTPDQDHRSLLWHALIPWFDAHRGVFLGDPDDRDRGLAAAADRLERLW